MKFEEAYVKPLDKIIDINELSLMKKSKFVEFAKTCDNLYCPECMKAKLVYVLSNPVYLRTCQNSEHSEDCSLKQEELSKTRTKEFVKEQNFDTLNRQLQRLILNLSSCAQKEKTDLSQKATIQKNNNGSFITNVGGKNFRFPQKRIDLPLFEDDYDKIKLFYGTVLCTWEKAKNGNDYRLLIYLDSKQRLLCRIFVKENIYKFVPSKMKFKGQKKCRIAFVASINKVEGKTYCQTGLIHSTLLELQQLNN